MGDRHEEIRDLAREHYGLPTPHGGSAPPRRAARARPAADAPNPSWGIGTVSGRPRQWRQTPPNPSWGIGTSLSGVTSIGGIISQPLMGDRHRSRRRTGPRCRRPPNPSWGIGTFEAAGYTVGTEGLPTPHGGSAPAAVGSMRSSPMGSQPLMGDRHFYVERRDGIRGDLPTPHGGSARRSAQAAMCLRETPNPSWGIGTRARGPHAPRSRSPNPSWGIGTPCRSRR